MARPSKKAKKAVARSKRRQTNTVARTMHDVGLAAWFGGSLMGAIGVNGAAGDVDDPRQRARVANAGWGRWTPVNAAAIGLHLAGSVQLLRANKGRVKHQKGVFASSASKTALTGAALGATAYARVLGQRMAAYGDVPVAAGTAPTGGTPAEVAKAQKQLKALQWAIPGLTGAIIANTALQGEQQKPQLVAAGTLQNLPSAAASAAASLGAALAPAASSARDAVAPQTKKARKQAAKLNGQAGKKASKAAAQLADRAAPLTDALAPRAQQLQATVSPYAETGLDYARGTLAPKAKELGETGAAYAKGTLAPKAKELGETSAAYAKGTIGPKAKELGETGLDYARTTIAPKAKELGEQVADAATTAYGKAHDKVA